MDDFTPSHGAPPHVNPRHLASSLSEEYRRALYNKTGGQLVKSTSGYMDLVSPISGAKLRVQDCQDSNRAVRDPISGTVLLIEHGCAKVTGRPTQNTNLRSKKFRVERDIDITIQELRATVKVGGKTNEKIGTSGSLTGMDPTLG